MAWLLLLLASLAVAACVALVRRGHPAYPHSPHFDAARQIFVNPQQLRGVTLFDGATGLLKMLQRDGQYGPVALLPTVSPDWPLFLKNDNTPRFIWFGHSTLLMRLGMQTVAVDPVLGPSVSPLTVNMRRFQSPAALLADWPQPDVVLLSHNHYDHFEEHTLRALARTPAQFIVPLGLGAYLKPLGVADSAITELDWWQHAQRGDLRITLVPALHTSGRSLSDASCCSTAARRFTRARFGLRPALCRNGPTLSGPWHRLRRERPVRPPLARQPHVPRTNRASRRRRQAESRDAGVLEESPRSANRTNSS